MTHQEAIDAIKSNYPCGGYHTLREALDMAIKALEKEALKMTKAERREASLRKQWGDKAYNFIDNMNSDEFVAYIRKATEAGRGNDLRAYFEELADKEDN